MRILLFILGSMTMLWALSAKGEAELRLFHEESSGLAKDAKKNTTENQFRTHKQLEETWVQYSGQSVEGTAILSDKYHYHGFIFSPDGIQYLVNGVSLEKLSSLELLSVKRGGRVLELQDSAGQVFLLSIGESVERNIL